MPGQKNQNQEIYDAPKTVFDIMNVFTPSDGGHLIDFNHTSVSYYVSLSPSPVDNSSKRFPRWEGFGGPRSSLFLTPAFEHFHAQIHDATIDRGMEMKKKTTEALQMKHNQILEKTEQMKELERRKSITAAEILSEKLRNANERKSKLVAEKVSRIVSRRTNRIEKRLKRVEPKNYEAELNVMTTISTSEISPRRSPVISAEIKSAVEVEDIEIHYPTDHKKGQSTLSLVFGADKMPPITYSSLSELNINSILNLTQLKHDILFDVHMEFKPNDDGPRGQLKKERSTVFWGTVIHQDLIVLQNPESTESQKQQSLSHILSVLWEIRLILSDIVADEYKKPVAALFDIQYISQQIKNGVYNFHADLIVPFAAILKIHCAPIRDESVDAIVSISASMDIATCLKMVFQLLERMKLDLANDQLQRARPYIVEEAVNFEWNLFRDNLKTQETGIDNTVSWLQSYILNPKEFNIENCEVSKSGLIIREGFLDIVNSTDFEREENAKFPETWKMDFARMHGFHREWHDIALSNALITLTRQYLGPLSKEQLTILKNEMHTIVTDSESDFDNVLYFIVDKIQKKLNSKMDQKSIDALHKVIERAIGDTEKSVYLVYVAKVRKCLMQILSNEKPLPYILKELPDFSEEVLVLGLKMKKVVLHNCKVYAPLYDQIFVTLNETK